MNNSKSQLWYYINFSARNKFHNIVNELVVKRRTLRKKTDVTLLVDVLIDHTDDEEKILHEAITLLPQDYTQREIVIYFLHFFDNHI